MNDYYRNLCGRALDVIFARKVLGWTTNRTDINEWYEPVSGLWKPVDSITKLPSCRHDLELVLEAVLLFFQDEHPEIRISKKGDLYQCQLVLGSTGESILMEALSPGEALAKAAVAIVPEEVVA